MSRFGSWEDYFVPGTQVLRNLVGITDADALRAFEEEVTQLRIQELATRPLPGDFDYAHFKAIHKYIFQDVYEWAGQERVGPALRMTKMGPDVLGDSGQMVPYAYFPAGAALTHHAETQFEVIRARDYLRGLSGEEFGAVFAEVWGELNVAHPFREGNTRTQIVFFAALAEHAGHPLDMSRLALGTRLNDEFVLARFYSQATGRNERLAQVVGRLRVARTVPKRDVVGRIQSRAQAIRRGSSVEQRDQGRKRGRL